MREATWAFSRMWKSSILSWNLYPFRRVQFTKWNWTRLNVSVQFSKWNWTHPIVPVQFTKGNWTRPIVSVQFSKGNWTRPITSVQFSEENWTQTMESRLLEGFVYFFIKKFGDIENKPYICARK